jgi:hypothetical protein
MLDANQLPLQPLGAGDLIDRAVRLYRRNFWPLIRIAAPPVIVNAAGWVMVTIFWRELNQTGSDAYFALFVLCYIVGWILAIVGLLLNMIVMGGAARNLVSHILLNEPVTARATYRNVVSRFWGLLGSSIIVGVILLIAASIAAMIWGFAFGLMMVGVGMLAMVDLPWLSVILGVVAFCVTGFGALWLFFLGAGRFAYVPQVLLVEGKGVFASIGRSAALASGNVKRLMAMVFFSIVATYSALMILVVPLGFFAWVNGVDPLSIQGANAPVWYSLSYQLLWQVSLIMLAPIWMLGLSLLYIDERVRHEAYDVELMAARRLGEPPRVPGAEYNPLVPALFRESDPVPQQPLRGVRPPQRTRPGSTLGLS